MKKICSNTGFTLVELLIVITIILILTGILLPSLGRAKMIGKQISCSNNLRQWTMASMNYVEHWKDFLPPYSHMNYELTASCNWNSRYSWLVNTFKPGLNYARWMAGNDINGCPSHSMEACSSPPITKKAYSYGMNYKLSSPKTRKITSIQNPTVLIYLTDMSDTIEAAGYNFEISPERIGYQHLGKTNALFIDGHVGRKELKDLTITDYTP